jgi:hypothetical protein
VYPFISQLEEILLILEGKGGRPTKHYSAL